MLDRDYASAAAGTVAAWSGTVPVLGGAGNRELPVNHLRRSSKILPKLL
jgi:hypothetical protein